MTILKFALKLVLAVMCLGSTSHAATTWYVSTNGNENADGTNWVTAVASISNAVAKAGVDDTVLVSNGTYAITQEIVVDKHVTITSVNGADVTVVDAGYVIGRRCFNISDADAVLERLTIKGGREPTGGGAGILMSAGTVQWCTLTGNGGSNNGGAISMSGGLVQYCKILSNNNGNYNGTVYMSGGTLRNCLVAKNTYRRGGGVYLNGAGARVESCTVVDNDSTEHTGGIYRSSGTVVNTIVYFNTDPDNTGENYNVGATFSTSCSTPLPGGTDNVTGDPLFVDRVGDNYRLLPGSPCTNAATTNLSWMASGTDLDGNPRVLNGMADMGCYQMDRDPLTCTFTGTPLSGFAPLQTVFTGYVSGTNQNGLGYSWDFETDGAPDATGAVATNIFPLGLYTVSLTVTNTAGESNTYTRASYVKSAPATNYVWSDGSDTSPYDTWAKAAHSVQDAIDAGVDGTLVLVTNGTYSSGSALEVTKGVTLRSVNGRSETALHYSSSGWTRTLYVSHPNAVVDGFSITNTASGGGVQIALDGIVQNCDILDAYWANGFGAGVSMSGGVLLNCTVSGCTDRYIGGVRLQSGGALAENCIIRNNANVGYSANSYGGGVSVASGCTLRNSLIIGNSGDGFTGGVINNGTIENCTIMSNSVNNADVSSAGGLRNSGTTRNCIIMDNVNDLGGVYTNWYYASGAISYSCTTPDVSAYGSDNITDDPLFDSPATGSYRLQGSSPCIDAGTNQTWMATTTDLDGRSRILGASVDMGAYETPLEVTNLEPIVETVTNAILRGEYLFDGGAGNPHTYICWGTNDWGTSSTGGWEHVLYLGTDWGTGETFGTNVNGLTAGIAYVYRCYASNTYETAWADPAEWFWTSRPPVVTNLGATAIGIGTATLVAEVLDTGGEIPTCWLHYWEDGSATTTTVDKALQSGVFSNAVSGLNVGSTYFYNASGSNTMGTAWSDTKSFRVIKPWHVTTNGIDSANGETWATALATISNAVERAGDNDTILVSNGTYSITAPIVIDKAITLRGVNGQATTSIDAADREDVRCMVVSNVSALVEGFTIERGYRSQTTGGGAAGLLIYDGTVQWCTFSANRGFGEGGSIWMKGGLVQYCTVKDGKLGIYAGTVRLDSGSGAILRNCLIHNNVFRRGGGVYLFGGRVENCTVVSNDGSEHTGGIYNNGGVVVNSIIYFNTDDDGVNENWGGSGFTYCCSTPLPDGEGNIADDPLIMDVGGRDFHLLLNSPCRDVGTNDLAWLATGTDLDGNPRMVNGKVDMGCYQYQEGGLDCSFIGDNLEGFSPYEVVFSAVAGGSNTTGLVFLWDFNNDGTNDATGAAATNIYAAGSFSVSLTVTNAIGESCTYTRNSYIQAAPPTNYVWAGGSDTFPYETWEKAAHDIQSAIDAGLDGTHVIVTNGTYSKSGVLNVTEGITLRSVNGRSETTLHYSGTDWIRTLYVSHSNAVVDGFTITRNTTGGGVQIHINGLIQNCDILNANWANGNGGSAIMTGGILRNCTLDGGRDRYIGGLNLDAGGALAENCIISDNANTLTTGDIYGGGVYVAGGCTLRNSLIVGNAAVGMTGGVINNGTLENCTVVSNSVNNADASAAGGLRNSGTTRNCIIVGNVNDLGGAFTNWYASGGTIEYTCTVPDASARGSGNVTGDPNFRDAPGGDYSVVDPTPCHDAGIFQAWMASATDLAGEPRVKGSTVDMGAYELPSYGTLFRFL